MEAIVFYLLKSAGILAIFFFSYQFFLKKETFFKTNRHYLLAGIIGSLLLPLVIFTNYIYVEPVVEAFNPNWLVSDIPIAYNTIEEAEPFNWFQLATYIYVMGVLVLAIRFAIQLTSLFKLFTSNTINKKEGFNLVEINSNMSPFSFFNYIVYNPKKYSSHDLEIIINHEKAHSNQLHSIDILVSQLFVILQWFNPVAWFYKKSIQQNLEFMADQFAISKVESAKHYQHTLLKASLKPQYASITNNFYNSLIKKRIIMLNQTKSNIKNTWKYFIILPALALFLMSFNVETVEVEKKTEAKELPTAFDLSFIDEDNKTDTNDSTVENTTKVEVFSSSETASVLSSIQKIIKKKIDKNTTDAELKTISEELKKENIDFTYKNVKRNANNAITGINITYKDSNGNTGNYALSSDNPINTFYFYKEDNGSIGFKSENTNSKQRLKIIEKREHAKAKKEDMMKEREHITEARMKMKEEHKTLSKERKREIEVRVEKAREKHQKKREEYQEQRKYIIKERMKLHDSLKDKHGNIFIGKHDGLGKDNLFFSGKDKVLFIVDGEESDSGDLRLRHPSNIKEMNVLKGDHALRIYGDKGKDGVVIITTKPHGENEFVYEFEHDMDEFHTNDRGSKSAGYTVQLSNENDILKIRINKDTTDEYLNRTKSLYSKEYGIDIKFSKLKRNKDGEITRIKISVNDNNGNKSSSSFNMGNKAISPILIGKNKGNLIIKSI